MILRDEERRPGPIVSLPSPDKVVAPLEDLPNDEKNVPCDEDPESQIHYVVSCCFSDEHVSEVHKESVGRNPNEISCEVERFSLPGRQFAVVFEQLRQGKDHHY